MEDISDIPPQWQAIPAQFEGGLSAQPAVSPAPLPVPFPAPAAELLACPCSGTLPRLCLEAMLSPAGPYPDWAGAAGHQGSCGGGWSWDLQDFSHSSFNTCAWVSPPTVLRCTATRRLGREIPAIRTQLPRNPTGCVLGCCLPWSAWRGTLLPSDLPRSEAEHTLPVSGAKCTETPPGCPPTAHGSTQPGCSSGVTQHRWRLLCSSCPWGHPVPGGLLAPLCHAGHGGASRTPALGSVLLCGYLLCCIFNFCIYLTFYGQTMLQGTSAIHYALEQALAHCLTAPGTQCPRGPTGLVLAAPHSRDTPASEQVSPGTETSLTSSQPREKHNDIK